MVGASHGGTSQGGTSSITWWEKGKNRNDYEEASNAEVFGEEIGSQWKCITLCLIII